MFRPSIVVDTNIFVAGGFRPNTASGRIVAAIRAGQISLVWNDATRRETIAVVEAIPPLGDHDWCALFTDHGHYAGPTRPDDFPGVDDLSDRKFAALAQATGVAVVSSDQDLLGPRRQMAVTVLRPTECVERIGPLAAATGWQ